MKNIVLIGFMGTGKTCVGRLLAYRLNRPFIDTDKKIEAECGMPISDIFTVFGEAYFRRQEKMVISKVSRYTNSVIATGGGAVLYPANIARLKQNGVVIALTASLDAILERTGRRNIRPLLNCENRKGKIAGLLQEREKLYNLADFSIDTSDSTPQQVIDTIMFLLRQEGYLRGGT